MVYTHGSHVPSDSLIGDILTRSRRSAPPLGSLSDAPRRGRRESFARRAVRRWGTSGVGLSWRTRWRMKPRASQPQNHSPCPRASPRSVLTGRRPGPRSGRAGARPSRSLSDTPRTGRAAEDVGPYHPSCPDAARRAKDSRRPRRGTSERARHAKDPRRLGAGLSGGGGGTVRRDRFVVDEKAAFARRGGNGVGG